MVGSRDTEGARGAASSGRGAELARSEVAAAILVSLALVVADVAGASTRPPAPSGIGLAGLALAGWPLGAALACLVVLSRGLIVHCVVRAGAGLAIVGMFDAAFVLALAVHAQSPRRLELAEARTLALGGTVALATLAAWAWQRWVLPRPVVGRVIAALIAAGASVAITQLRWNGEPWTRLAFASCVVVAASHAAAPIFARGSRTVVIVAAAALAAAGAAAWLFVLPSSRDARLALYHRSSHVRSWAYVIDRRLYEPPRAGSARRVPEPGDDGPAVALRGSARGHDVLLLSLDSLRWDGAPDLAALRRAIGPHADFRWAVSPAPATRDSLTSTLRGRPVSQLQIDPAPGASGDILWRDRSPTLGHLLARAGYRVLTFATSNQSDPRIGIQSGFDTRYPAGADLTAGPGLTPLSPYTLDYAGIHLLAPSVVRVAEETPGRLCLWLHLMEPHSPYHWSPTQVGPRGMPAFRRSVRYVARELARLLTRWSAVRRRPFVVAVFGDHGEEMGEHGGSYHGTSVHAEQSRVVFWLAGGGLRQSAVTSPVSTAAIPATVLDLLGIQPPRTMTIGSLLPALSGHAAWPTMAVTEMRSPYRAAIGYTTANHRLIRDARHDVDQLFDLTADPTEQRDLAVSRPSELARMRALADRWDAANR